MPEAIAVEMLRTTAELEAFRPEWSALYERDPQATPFQSAAWLLPWWRQFGQPELRAAVVRTGDAAVGFLPFYIYTEPETGERKLMPLGVGTADYLDGLFAPGFAEAAASLALEAVLGEAGWDALYCSQLRAESPLRKALSGLGRSFAGEPTSRMQAVRFGKLPQKIRRNAMYYRNRALRGGMLELVEAGEDDCLAAFEDLVRLHTASWQVRGEPGVLADPRVLAWHREALPLLARTGLLRLQRLRWNNVPIAVLYGLGDLIDPIDLSHPTERSLRGDLLGRPERTVYFYLTAFSPEHAELRPGTLLLAHAIERAAEKGAQTIDMLRGEEAYKSLWHLERTPTFGFALTSAEFAARRLGSAA